MNKTTRCAIAALEDAIKRFPKGKRAIWISNGLFDLEALKKNLAILRDGEGAGDASTVTGERHE